MIYDSRIRKSGIPGPPVVPVEAENKQENKEGYADKLKAKLKAQKDAAKAKKG